jgi:hypothetical protein
MATRKNFTTLRCRHGAVRQFADGWTADQFGAPLVVAVRGAFCAIAGIIFAWHLPRLRRAAQPILAARGIVLESNVSE